MTEFKYLNLPPELELEYNAAVAQFMLYTPEDLKNMCWKTLSGGYQIYFTSTGAAIRIPQKTDEHVKEIVYAYNFIRAERIVLQGKKDGYSRIWDEDHVLIADQMFKDDEMDGLQIRYYETGELKERSYYERGNVRRLEKYGKDGTLKKVEYYKIQKDLNKDED
jgi:hypothetical protein